MSSISKSEAIHGAPEGLIESTICITPVKRQQDREVLNLRRE
jgi:hypothetical protein